MRNEIKMDIRKLCHITILVNNHDAGIVFHPTNKKLATLFTSLDDVVERFGPLKAYFSFCHNLGSTQLAQML
jgi:hypothetical protein